MIFVTLGSQKFQFNRLLKAIDETKFDDEIFAQIGFSDYLPKNYKYEKFLDKDKLNNILNDSDIIITHGGAGTIIEALKRKKKVIAIARNSKYGEHIDNHQKEVIDKFASEGYICTCEDLSRIKEVIDIAKSKNFKLYNSNNNEIMEDIDKTITNWSDLQECL